MGQVRWGQKGYNGYSMSHRAQLAYSSGEKPLSKFRKEDAQQLTELIRRLTPEYAPGKPLTVAQTKTIMRAWGCSSWHHTGKYANRTDFYHLSALFDNYDCEDFDPENATEEETRIFQARIKQWAQENPEKTPTTTTNKSPAKTKSAEEIAADDEARRRALAQAAAQPRPQKK